MTLRRDRRGGVGLILGFAMPVLIGMAALAVDVGSVALERRRLQGLADAAALAAAAAPEEARHRAEAVVAAARWQQPVTVSVAPGRYARDRARAAAARFMPGAVLPDAVRVELSTRSPTYLARLWGMVDVPIARTATAAATRVAAFTIGTRLASLRGGLVNALLGALTGSSLAVNVDDYEGLARADVDLFDYVEALRSHASLGASTYAEAVSAELPMPQLLEVLARTLEQGGGSAGAARALRAVAAVAPAQTMALRDLIDVGPLGDHRAGGRGLVRIGALPLIAAILQQQPAAVRGPIDLGVALPGIGQTRAMIAAAPRPAGSPWIAIADDGRPTIHTAQTRVVVDASLAPALLPGLAAPVAIRIPLVVETGRGEARLSSLECAAAAPRAVTLEARPGPALAAIAGTPLDRLGDFSVPLALTPATLVDTALVDVEGRAVIDAGSAEPWQTLRFDAGMIGGPSHWLRSSRPAAGLARSLVQQLSVSVRVIGLPIPLDPLTRQVGGVLGAAAPALDQVLEIATGLVGVRYGEAEVQVTGARCGMAALIG